jgi:hypothetical protein
MVRFGEGLQRLLGQQSAVLLIDDHFAHTGGIDRHHRRAGGHCFGQHHALGFALRGESEHVHRPVGADQQRRAQYADHMQTFVQTRTGEDLADGFFGRPATDHQEMRACFGGHEGSDRFSQKLQILFLCQPADMTDHESVFRQIRGSTKTLAVTALITLYRHAGGNDRDRGDDTAFQQYLGDAFAGSEDLIAQIGIMRR